MKAPVPVTGFVLLPALAVLNRTALLKLAALVGLKPMMTLVEPNPGRLNGVPEIIENTVEPGTMLAVPPFKAAPPVLVATKIAWELEPTASVPKLKLAGVTTNWGGVNPVPDTEFVLLPPLLENITTLLKPAAFVGLNVMDTKPVWLGVKVKGLPLWTPKGGVPLALPVRVVPPVFTN